MKQPIPVSAAALVTILSAARDRSRGEVLLPMAIDEAHLLQKALAALPAAIRANRGTDPALADLVDEVWRQYHSSEIGRLGGDITKPLIGVDPKDDVNLMTAEGRRKLAHICGVVQSLLNSFQAIHAAGLRVAGAYRTHALPFFGISNEPTPLTTEGDFCITLNTAIGLVLQSSDRGAGCTQRLITSLRTLEMEADTIGRAFVVDPSL